MEKGGNQSIETSFNALGTSIVVRIVIASDEEKERATLFFAEVRAQYDRLQKIFDRFNEESELSRLNKHLTESVPASLEMIAVAERALSYNEKTDGYFDPRIIEVLEDNGYYQDFKKISASEISQRKHGSIVYDNLSRDLVVMGGCVEFGARMDFSGIVKGYVTDHVVKMLIDQGWKNFIVDSGGDMFCSGQDERGEIWRVDLEGMSHQKLMLELADCAVATSGISRRKWEKDGKRFHHLVNPKKPDVFSFDIRSVTVVAQSAEEADVWAKTLYLMGSEKGMICANEKNIPCIMLKYNGSALTSLSLQKYVYGKNK